MIATRKNPAIIQQRSQHIQERAPKNSSTSNKIWRQNIRHEKKI